jgi:hypothetical protein
MTYGEISRNATDIKVFNSQQKIIMIIADCKRNIYCGELFKKINILPLTSKYLLSLPSFTVEKIQRNSHTHYKFEYKYA